MLKASLKENDILTVKLANGEEIVARLIEISSEKLLIRKPMSLVAGAQGVGLAPWIFTIDQNDEIAIDRRQIISYMRTVKEFADVYIEHTSSIKPATSAQLQGLGKE